MVSLFGADDPHDVPIAGLSADENDTFNAGDQLFDLPLLAGDGLGPLYTHARSSGDCHDGRRARSGPLSLGREGREDPGAADNFTPAVDQSLFPFGHTVPLVAGGGNCRSCRPSGELQDLKVTVRVGAPILGRRYIEAVGDAEIRARRRRAGRAQPSLSHGSA